MANPRVEFERALLQEALPERVLKAFSKRSSDGDPIPKGTLFEVHSKKGPWWSEMKRGVVLEAKENGAYGSPMNFGHQGWSDGSFKLTPTEMAGGKILLDAGGRSLLVIPHTAERAADHKLESQLRDVLQGHNRGMDDPSEQEAEMLLRNKFRYTDAKIRKLKENRRRF